MLRNTYILLVAILWGCELTTKVNIPPAKPKLAVNSFFTPDSSWTVTVHSTKDVLSNDDFFDPIGNAAVEVYQGDLLIATLTHLGEGVYKAPSNIDPEEPYRLQVTANGFEDAAAESVVPQQVNMGSIEITDPEENELDRHITLEFDDPSGIDNYYEIVVYYRDSITTIYEDDTIYSINSNIVTCTSSDPIVNKGDEFYHYGLLFKDDTFEGGRARLEFDVYDYYSHAPNEFTTVESSYIIGLRSVSKDYFLYLTTAFLQNESGENPFAQPIVVYNNIRNGVGIFAGYSQDVRVVEIEP